MFRKEPEYDSNVLGNFGRLPEEATREYFISRAEDERNCLPDVEDEFEETPESIYALNKKENEIMMEYQKELVQRKREMAALNQSRIEILDKMQIDLREQFISSTIFFRECRERRETANKLLIEQELIADNLMAKIKQANADIEVLSDFKKVFEQSSAAYEPYERVLDEVVAAMDKFENRDELMAHCDDLLTAKHTIATHTNETLAEIEAIRQSMINLTIVAKTQIMQMATELNSLSRKLTELQNQVFFWERAMTKLRNEMGDRYFKSHLAREGIYDLYRMLCKRNRTEPIYSRYETEGALMAIKEEFEIIRLLVEECENEEGAKKGNKTDSEKSFDVKC